MPAVPKPAARLKKLADAPRIEFGPLAHYHPLVADDDTPLRTGIQTSAPGYVAPPHWHPYTEVFYLIEGEAEAWLLGAEDEPVRLTAGDCVVFPPNIAHSFRTIGEQPMRLLGIHVSAVRIVNYLDREADQRGYPVLGETLEPVR